MRFLLTHPSETRPSLVVDTCREIDGGTEESLRMEMWSLGCPTGIIFDEMHCEIFRDQFASAFPESITRTARLSTSEVLSTVPALDEDFLDDRVERWLNVLSDQWARALPRTRLTDHFLADVVPAASGSAVHPLHARKRR